MADITASMVKDLRETTGAGMMDCKKALEETSGDIPAAVDLLRVKGLAKAAKKADRVASEGVVAVAATRNGAGATAAAIELNSETDFVARNETFQTAARQIAHAALSVDGDVEALRRRQGRRRRDRWRTHHQPDRHDRREHDAAPRRAC